MKHIMHKNRNSWTQIQILFVALIMVLLKCYVRLLVSSYSFQAFQIKGSFNSIASVGNELRLSHYFPFSHRHSLRAMDFFICSFRALKILEYLVSELNSVRQSSHQCYKYCKTNSKQCGWLMLMLFMEKKS